MARSRKDIDADRLIQAAEAVMAAVTETASRNGGRCPHPAELVGTDSEPQELWEYSRDEVAEATAFLVRLGYLESLPPRTQV